jgi:hypothetical protein
MVVLRYPFFFAILVIYIIMRMYMGSTSGISPGVESTSLSALQIFYVSILL